METDGRREALSRQLREIEWGQAAPWVAYPPMAWWWPLAFGLWTGTFTLTMALLDGPLQALVQLGHVLASLAAIWWMRRVRGVHPTGPSPRELRAPFALLLAGAPVVALAIWGVHVALGPWAAAATGTVLAATLVTAYEWSYARASARVRERLG